MNRLSVVDLHSKNVLKTLTADGWIFNIIKHQQTIVVFLYSGQIRVLDLSSEQQGSLPFAKSDCSNIPNLTFNPCKLAVKHEHHLYFVKSGHALVKVDLNEVAQRLANSTLQDLNAKSFEDDVVDVAIDRSRKKKAICCLTSKGKLAIHLESKKKEFIVELEKSQNLQCLAV